MEKLNNDYEIDIEYEDTTCPICEKHRFWLKFYCGETLLVCRDCSYWKLI